jgi:UDP-N-acetylglucosamine/UDP-N-acetylgalactosamine 4-epimerase
MEAIDFDVSEHLRTHQEKWLVTGAAGFIGSNLCLALLESGQKVLALDNLVTGQARNVNDLENAAQGLPSETFQFIEGSTCDLEVCEAAMRGTRYVLHQAAIGSVPRSVANPLASHRSNVDGFITMLEAARLTGLERLVYASSSSVYGDSQELPKVEARTGNLLSPYAATKAINELYASVFQRTYGVECIGLRYFNVFGPRQDPMGQYAAVIPKWIQAILTNEPIVINGDGSTSRDFCYIKNVVQANLRAALLPRSFEQAQVLNIAYGDRTTLLELANALREGITNSIVATPLETNPQNSQPKHYMQPVPRNTTIEHAAFRVGDVLHSRADISKAQKVLGYQPTHSLTQGLAETCPWYLTNRDRLL